MTTTSTQRGGLRVGVQRFGTFLSGMIMPNIAAFIAWGIITAFFIADGFTPVGALGGFGENADGTPYVGLVGPMITYLLPLLIANTGGRMIYGTRGGVVGTIATMGVIVGSPVPMFLGAMIVGPLTAYLMKKVDALWAGKIKAGFEMLVDNFSAGILAFAVALGAFFGIAPVVTGLSNALEAGVDWLVNAGLLPLASILIEPGKILFLNNAINHGVLTPLGIAQSEDTGKSILFLLEANPGPGLGILLAFTFFGVGLSRASAPGAILIQFFGGIHEIYFPYVLMKPLLVLAAIGGGMTGVAINVLFAAGLRAPASPGSILAIYAQTASDSYLGVTLSVIGAAAVSFLIAAVILRSSRKADLAAEAAGEDKLAAAVAQNASNKGKDSNVGSLLGQSGGTAAATAPAAGTTLTEAPVRSIVFACDAGMGSSAMGATVMRNKIKKAGIDDVTVVNQSIANLTGEADLVITQRELTERARQQSPNSAHVSVDNFMNSPKYDEVVELIKEQHNK
ncbi:MAG TPA: PTS mannitol transporter subunit IICB [Glaciihabitans sp.]|jgi:PTS system mannitol-specific IIC component|nr:PTS mannitol transporter subunit IICB [Glaciihabitans sp.]